MNKKMILSLMMLLGIILGIGLAYANPPSDLPWRGPVPMPIPQLPEPAPFPYPNIPPFAPFPMPTPTNTPTPTPTPTMTPPPINIVNVFTLPDSADPQHNINGTQVLLGQTGNTIVDKYAIVIGAVNSGAYSVEEMTNYSGTWTPSTEVTTDRVAILQNAVNSNLISNAQKDSYIGMFNDNTAKLFWNVNSIPVNTPTSLYVISFRAVSGGTTIAMYNNTFTVVKD